MFIKQLIFLLFSWKGRIGRLDFNIGLIIWLFLFFIIQFLLITLLNNQIGESNSDNISSIFFLSIGLMFILIPLLLYIIFALKKKRMNDLGLKNSIFSLNLVTIYKKGDEKENIFGKRKIIFKSKLSKILGIISIIIMIIGGFILLLSSIQNMFNNNYLVIESKNKIENNQKIEKIIGEEVTFGNISGGISTINGITNISVNYIVNGNLGEGKVLLGGNNESGTWEYEKFILKIGGKQYNLENY